MDKKSLVGIAFVLGIALAVYYYGYPHMRSFLEPWYDPVLSEQEVNAAIWVNDNVPHGSQFAGDLFACEMLTAVARQICSVGGAWELADNPNDRYSVNERVFLTNSSKEAYDGLKKYGQEYVLVYQRTSFYAYGWKAPEIQKFNDGTYFQKIYDKGGAYVFKVKP